MICILLETACGCSQVLAWNSLTPPPCINLDLLVPPKVVPWALEYEIPDPCQLDIRKRVFRYVNCRQVSRTTVHVYQEELL